MAGHYIKDPIKRDINKGHTLIICHEFATETSAHGMSHIIRARGTCRKLFWLVVTLGLIAIWLLQSQDTIRKYLKNEVNVQVEIKASRELPFPAVTICNKNPYKGDDTIRFIELMNHTATLALSRNQSLEDIAPSWFVPWVRSLVSDDATFETGISSAKFGEQMLQLLAELVEVYGEYHNFSLSELSVDPDNFILNCMYERVHCDMRNDIEMTSIFNWLYGGCIVYIIKQNTTRTGPRFGLELTLNIEQSDYMDLTTQAGALVLVHPPEEMPFPEDDGISIPPGQAALIGVKVKRTERLGGKFGDCAHANKLPNFTNYFQAENPWTNYSLKACQRSCFQWNVRQMCQCLDVRFPPFDEYKNFTSCVNKYFSTFNFSQGFPESVGCLDEVTKKFNAHQLGCDKLCHVPCKQTYYEPFVSYAAWPSDAALNVTLENLKGSSASADEILEVGHDNFRKNFLQLTVYFQDLNFEFITEKEAVELTQMLSDLGGNTGMYVGASLFTMIEFVELFGDLWLWVCCHRMRRKRPKYAPPTEEDLDLYFITPNPSKQNNNHTNNYQNRQGHAPNQQNRHGHANNKQNRQPHPNKHDRRHSKNNGRAPGRGQDNNGYHFNYNGHLERPRKSLPRTPLPMDMAEVQDTMVGLY